MILNKACCIEDFSDPDLLSVLTEWFAPLKRNAPMWPQGAEDRKFWEAAMILLAVRQCLPSDRRIRALGVGAGVEASSFILTNMFESVLATDLYSSDEWNSDAPSGMLKNPQRYAHGLPFKAERLAVASMDARSLQLGDGVFDFVFSSSAIEHFGSMSDIARSAREIGRVLRPGGIAALSTELILTGPTAYLSRSTVLFDFLDIIRTIVEPSGLTPVGRIDETVSSATLDAPTSFESTLTEAQMASERLSAKWNQYPHLVLSHGDTLWTSFHLTLQKPLP